MPSANPLTMYVPILQTPDVQAKAKFAAEHFNNAITKDALDKMAIVHYARVALVPNYNAEGTGIAGVLVITEFDGNMDQYLRAFYDKSTTIRAVFIALIDMWAFKPEGFPTDPNKITYDIFSNFINNSNRSQPAEMYYAYPQTVKQIVAKFAK